MTRERTRAARRACSPGLRAVSLALMASCLLPPGAGAASLCLRLESAGRMIASIPAADGSTLRLSFRHSLYGSTVEEDFKIGRKGLLTVRLAYAELRLVEYYGREDARRVSGRWVVIPEPRSIEKLDLRPSPASSMRLALDGRPIPIDNLVGPDGALSVAVTSCPGPASSPSSWSGKSDKFGRDRGERVANATLNP